MLRLYHNLSLLQENWRNVANLLPVACVRGLPGASEGPWRYGLLSLTALHTLTLRVVFTFIGIHRCIYLRSEFLIISHNFNEKCEYPPINTFVAGKTLWVKSQGPYFSFMNTDYVKLATRTPRTHLHQHSAERMKGQGCFLGVPPPLLLLLLRFIHCLALPKPRDLDLSLWLICWAQGWFMSPWW